MTRRGREVYKRALEEVRGSEWMGICFPVRDITVERTLKAFRDECDRISGDDEDGA